HVDRDPGRELLPRLDSPGTAERRLCGVAGRPSENSGGAGREDQRDDARETTDHGSSLPAGQANGLHVNVQPTSPTSHCASRSVSPMLQDPSPLTSQTSGCVNGATPQRRRPTSNCATRRASPMSTTPSPFTSPQRTAGIVVLVVDVELVVDVVVELVDVSAEARASIRPKPLASSNPGGPMSTAPRVRAACTSAGVSVGSWSSSKAAIPAECGAAADVPKKAQKGGQAGKPPAFEIATPSNATRSGLARISSLGKSMRAGPCELNASTPSRPGS